MKEKKKFFFLLFVSGIIILIVWLYFFFQDISQIKGKEKTFLDFFQEIREKIK